MPTSDGCFPSKLAALAQLIGSRLPALCQLTCSESIVWVQGCWWHSLPTYMCPAAITALKLRQCNQS